MAENGIKKPTLDDMLNVSANSAFVKKLKEKRNTTDLNSMPLLKDNRILSMSNLDKMNQLPKTVQNRERSVEPKSGSRQIGLTNLKTHNDDAEETNEYGSIDYSNMGLAKLRKISDFSSNKRNTAS